MTRLLIDFIRRAPPADLRRMLLLGMVAGLANAVLVVMINQLASGVAQNNRPGLWDGIAFLAIFILYYACDRYALLQANAIIERLLKALRIELMDKVRQSELRTVDGLGRGKLFTLIAQETNRLSVAFPMLIDSFQQAVLLCFSLLYLAWLSFAAFLVFIFAVGAGFWIYRQIDADFRVSLQDTAERQLGMMEIMDDLVNGFKELRLNTRRSDAALAAYGSASDSLGQSLAASGGHWASMILLSSFVTYIALGAVGFILPQYGNFSGTLMFQLVPTLLFCFGPLGKIFAQSPLFIQAGVGLRAIVDVERKLDAAGAVSPESARAEARFAGFQRISYEGATYSHRDVHGEPVFTVGPLNLVIERGEVLFIVGDNGAGKSTTLRLMTGLYPCDKGCIRVDGVVLDDLGKAGFREMFAAIFAGFHLFDRLYGLEDVDPSRVRSLIAQMGLAHKVTYADGRFSQTSLSTGQRKRLALIAALLEDRPIYVFDEWSAEQDVHFRAYFYTELLPSLRDQGKTVIVVSHDERYWEHADRVIRLGV